eukprot:gnl/TRDRNA2_/TRDRNA2_197954_c0_seq1.p1 gnl/TRDRNA2_/TRDRNA2_197954_c0~~gnl/TRDRNA2_/TRDRNA2_197954_c0_seq1.p1  ORF type:complete len:369 (+),score=61.35 gnl/TRDRNA2_/TRDRNA2_197954_c0_seq1:114-1220(+)
MDNVSRRAEEIEALQAIFGGEGEFDLVSDPSESGCAFRVKTAAAGGEVATVLVTLPAGYPADESPSFVLESFKPTRAASLAQGLEALAKERAGTECVFEVLSMLEELEGEVTDGATTATQEGPPRRLLFVLGDFEYRDGLARALAELHLTLLHRAADAKDERHAARGKFCGVHGILDAHGVSTSARQLEKLRGELTGVTCDVLEELDISELPVRRNAEAIEWVPYRSPEELDDYLAKARRGEAVLWTASSSEAAVATSHAWAFAIEGGSTLLHISVTSGPKVKKSQITNVSEMKRMPQTPTVCIDLQPSRNTENYELATLLATCTKVSTDKIELIDGSKKDKASGDRQVRITGVSPEEVVARILGNES